VAGRSEEFPHGAEDVPQYVQLPSLPARSVLVLDSCVAVAAGWDSIVYALTRSSGADTDWRVSQAVGRSLQGALG
jgi:hypothetical protein